MIKTVKIEDKRTQDLMDEVLDLLRRRGIERLPASVAEGVAEVSRGGRVTQPVLVHLGLLALHRHLTDVKDGEVR